MVRSWSLVVPLLAASLGLSALLAIPLSAALEEGLEHRDAASTMMYGFDYSWWSRWSELQGGFVKSFRPDIFDKGFVLKDWNLVLRGELPGRVFYRGDSPELDPTIAGLGVLYLLVQAFLAGGILGVLRGPGAHWTVRSLLHGSGFYFGRFVRLALVVLFVDLLIFGAYTPLARVVDPRALESPTETAALAWSLGKYLGLALALLFIHMVSCYAKVIIVLEERTSALLAFVSALTFCLARLGRTAVHYALVLLAGAVVFWAWSRGDLVLHATGYTTQLVVFAWGELLIAARLALRLGLWGGQIEIYRRSLAPAP
jgi:hypothetical protein